MIRDVLEVSLYCDRKNDLSFWAEFAKRAKILGGGFAGLIKLLYSEFNYNPGNYFWPMKHFFNLQGGWESDCWQAFDKTCKDLEVPPHMYSFIDTYKNMGLNLKGSIMTIVPRYLSDLTSSKLVRHVWLNPIEAPENSLQIEGTVDYGKVLIYSPGDNSFISDAIGRQIKRKFFATTFTRDNKERPVAYVCDEFQRYITGDPESGEQSFLDRCRAYRGICVLATQSIASIKKALGDTGEQAVDDTISIILNNTGTKLFFRNTDTDTQGRLRQMIPINTLSGSGHHVMDVRPISTLSVGECYYLLSDSKWGRAQVSLKKETEPGPKPQNVGTESITEQAELRSEKSSADCSTHKLMSDVTPESIIKLCDDIDQAVKYYKYRHVKIEICSPGGAILALQHYIFKLGEWRKLGVTIETVAIMSVASAAAMILSLGDVGHRSAYPVAKLLYHNSLIPSSSGGHKEHFTQIASELEYIDDYLQGHLVKHIWADDNDCVPEGIDLPALRERELNGKKMNHYLPTLGTMSEYELEKPSREHYKTVLGELFEKDMPIGPEDAKLLGLIDRVMS